MLAVWTAILPLSGTARAQQVQMNPGLTPLLRYFELRISSGRIAARSAHKDRKLESQASNNDRRERLSITLSGDATTISYELATSEWQISFEVLDGKEVVLRRQSKDHAVLAPLVFHQPVAGPLSLRVGEGAVEQTYQADNLWRLLAAEPEVCSRHLTPLIELLKPDWHLAETAQAAEQALYAAVRTMSGADQTELRTLVNELASPKFARRQAAERNLRAIGRDALPFLMSIDWRQLDAEQRFRLQTMFHELSGGGEADTPERIALWLIRDPQLWLQLLARDDESHRRLALEQLERLLGRKLPFDPAADETVRRGQLEALQKLFGEPAPPRGE